MSYSEYKCAKCGAVFGIAGESSGTDEDFETERYFDETVEWHETGECSKGAEVIEPTSEQLSIRADTLYEFARKITGAADAFNSFAPTMTAELIAYLLTLAAREASDQSAKIRAAS